MSHLILSLLAIFAIIDVIAIMVAGVKRQVGKDEDDAPVALDFEGYERQRRAELIQR